MIQDIIEHINDVTRLCVVYIHILAVSIAIGTIFLADVRFITGKLDSFSILCTKNIILYTLIVLYITGATIVYIDYGTLFVDLTTAPKLAAKLFVVGLLTLNGFILHHYILPMFSVLPSLTPTQRAIMGISAAFSAVSWCYAIFLGKAKPFVSFFGLNDFIELYLLIVSVAVVLGAVMMIRHTSKESEENISLVKESFRFIKKMVLYIIDSVEYLYYLCVKYMRRDVLVQGCIIISIVSLCTYIIIIMLESNGLISSDIANIKTVPLLAFNEKKPLQEQEEVHDVNFVSKDVNSSNFSTMKISLKPDHTEDVKKIIFVSLAQKKNPVVEQKQNYILQISALQSKKSAEKYVQKLLQQHKNNFLQYPIRIVPHKGGSAYWHRIRIYGVSYNQGKVFCKILHLKECFLSRSH